MRLDQKSSREIAAFSKIRNVRLAPHRRQTVSACESFRRSLLLRDRNSAITIQTARTSDKLPSTVDFSYKLVNY